LRHVREEGLVTQEEAPASCGTPQSRALRSVHTVAHQSKVEYIRHRSPFFLLGQELPMPFDLSTVYWAFVGLMTLLAFVASLLGGLIAFRNPLAGAIIAAVLFAAGFVAWNYYPHDFGLPIIKTIGMDGAPG
jgi:hypothetical protein